MLRRCLGLLVLFLAFGYAHAAELSREQALRHLSSDEAPLRHAGVIRLAEIGRMEDAKALLPRLKDQDEDVREAAQLALWAVWSRSGDQKIDALLAQGTLAMNSGQFEIALESFNRVVKQKPDFAEGWNKRATLYFLAGETRKSIADCDQVLKRNPNHFGALSGYGQLYLQLGEPEKALQYFERAYAINPGMQGVAVNIDGIKRLLEQRRRRAT
jgi:tetratricopeptide (TPR) repeat protein